MRMSGRGAEMDNLAPPCSLCGCALSCRREVEAGLKIAGVAHLKAGAISETVEIVWIGYSKLAARYGTVRLSILPCPREG